VFLSDLTADPGPKLALALLAVALLASGPHARIYVTAPGGGPPELLDPVIFQVRREGLRAMIRTDFERAFVSGSL
jgi:hypothetical protein